MFDLEGWLSGLKRRSANSLYKIIVSWVRIPLLLKLYMLFRIKISTKNKNSLNLFLTAISKLKTSTRLIKCLSKQKQKKFVTVLKSPHVNKSSQEQFEYRTFSKILFIYSSQPNKDLFVLKSLKNSSFSGVKWQISIKSDNNDKVKYLLDKLNPDNLELELTKNSAYSKEVQYYIKSFDNYGELVLKKFQIQKSVNMLSHL